MDKRIRLSSTDSVNSVNKKNLIDVEIEQHTKLFPFPSLSYTIDQMEQFEKERSESTKYRLILTINPYCSNILFNAVTEIVQNEGTNDVNDLKIASSNNGFTDLTIDGYDINGKTGTENDKLTNTDMVRNTEYSNGDNPFVYHCGYDIFNNHILRNKTFKLVNPITNESDNMSQQRSAYNTINDYMRYSDGTNVKYSKRNDVKTIIEGRSKHLYLKDDILEFIDSINANITEENGWWGFYNHSSIPSCKYDDNVKKWEDLNISKVFNNEDMGCGFIEMYPDSSLYSFNPKYNSIQNREEHNWDICITYPFENDDEKPLVCGELANNDSFNALLIASAEQIIGISGQPIILFRTYVKHNLKIGDEIVLFYGKKSENGVFYNEIEDKVFKVVNIGNMENEHQDYFFYINDVDDILQEMNITEPVELKNYDFRFIKMINNRKCKYYYRKFKKLPNFKFKKQELTQDIANNKEDFENYVNSNCKVAGNGDEMLPFSKEQYPLAFSKTIYNDAKTQIVFTDTIDIDKVVDNLGRPLTELFITIIKRNKGHELWYKKNKTEADLQKIEFSHCFGKLISGIQLYGEWTDDNSQNKILDCRFKCDDVTLLSNTNYSSLDNDITIEKDEFYGDVVELDCYNLKETVLSDVYFRFNTEQREHVFENDELNCGTFIYDEIETDDYDINDFKCNAIDMDCVNSKGLKENGENDDSNCKFSPSNSYKVHTTYRPEGYFYKAHYPFLIREFGAMNQGSHKELIVSSCKPRQSNGMFIEVVSVLNHNLAAGDTVFLCDDETDETIALTVNTVISNVRFLLNQMKPTTDNYKSVFEICRGLMYTEKTILQNDIDMGYSWIDEHGSKHIASNAIKDDDENETTIIETDLNKKVFDYSKPKYRIRIKNELIPFYAYKVDKNLYLWRELLTVGNKDTVDLEEYPFANGHFYINKEINFFLKRQDPFGYNELYDEEIVPNDIAGNIKKDNIYEYKDETHSIC